MNNEQYLTDLFIYQAESLAASDVDMIDGDDFEIEYDGGHSGDVSISGLMAEALKRLRKAETERDELAAQFSEMASLADSLTFASSEDEADEIVQKIAGLVHDEGGALTRRDASMKTEALEELAAQPGMEHFTASRAVAALSAEYRKQAEGES